MGTKLKQNGVEFNDGTLQTTAATNTENFTDLQDTPRDFTREISRELQLYPSNASGNLPGSPVTLFGDTTNGRDMSGSTQHLNLWDGNNTTYFSMPAGVSNGWKYPDESWILVTFQDDTGGLATLQTRKISKIILTTGPSSHSGMGGYTFGVYGIVNSAGVYGALDYSFSSPDGILQSHSNQTGIPAGEGVRKELLKGTVFGSTVQGDYVQADYIIGTSFPKKHVWVLDTPVEVQHLEFRLSRYTDSVSSSNVIGGIEIFDNQDNKYVVRLNSDGTALELSDDHETRITSVENNVSTLDSDMTAVEGRITSLELREDKDILLYPYYGYLSSTYTSTWDIRSMTANQWENSATTWQNIIDGINAAYPPSLYDVGKRLFFKPHVYYNGQIGSVEHFREFVWLLTVRPSGYSYFTYNNDGSKVQPNNSPLISSAKFWHVEYNGLPKQLSAQNQINWNTYDGS